MWDLAYGNRKDIVHACQTGISYNAITIEMSG